MFQPLIQKKQGSIFSQGTVKQAGNLEVKVSSGDTVINVIPYDTLYIVEERIPQYRKNLGRLTNFPY